MIPFPYAADDHQRNNAEALQAGGAARMIVQQELSGERLIREIRDLAENPTQLDRMEEASRKLAHGDAASTVADLIGELVRTRI